MPDGLEYTYARNPASWTALTQPRTYEVAAVGAPLYVPASTSRAAGMSLCAPHPICFMRCAAAAPSARPRARVSVCAPQIADDCWPTQIGMNRHFVAL